VQTKGLRVTHWNFSSLSPDQTRETKTNDEEVKKASFYEQRVGVQSEQQQGPDACAA
jgi:hypothetical protein